MDEEEVLPCYGLDVSNDHDVGMVTFKFLDTDKMIHLTQLELSIFANYILDQYSSTPKAISNLEMIETISDRIESLEDCLKKQINSVSNRVSMNENELLCKLDNVTTEDDLNRLKSEYLTNTAGILGR